MKRGILITARLKSTRLPFKVIKDIMGKPMIVHMLDRLKLSKLSDQIIICTSGLKQDNPLINIAEENNVMHFCGDPDDVLIRLLNAADNFGIDTIINCTADNPFVDPVYIDKLIKYHENNNNDFSKIEGLPFGVFSYAINKEALRKLCEIKVNIDTEVWHGYFMNTQLFKWSALEVQDKYLCKPKLRLTVDTPEDFQLVEKIFENLYNEKEKAIFPLSKIIKFCELNPAIAKINANISQKLAPGLKIKGDSQTYEA